MSTTKKLGYLNFLKKILFEKPEGLKSKNDNAQTAYNNVCILVLWHNVCCFIFIDISWKVLRQNVKNKNCICVFVILFYQYNYENMPAWK